MEIDHLISKVMKHPKWPSVRPPLDDFGDMDLKAWDPDTDVFGSLFKGVPGGYVQTAMVTAAKRSLCDEMKKHLLSLKWNKKPHLDDWLWSYAGAHGQSRQYLRTIGVKWMVSVVARVMEPDCETDGDIVFVEEGASDLDQIAKAVCIGGSFSWLKQPRGSWFRCFSDHTTRSAEGFQQLQEERSHNGVLIGVSDTMRFMREGDDRIWPVLLQEGVSRECDDAIVFSRKDIWAEAVHRYKQGEAWRLTDEERDLLRVVQRPFVYVDSRVDVLKTMLESRCMIGTGECLQRLWLAKDEQDELRRMMWYLDWEERDDLIWYPKQ